MHDLQHYRVITCVQLYFVTVLLAVNCHTFSKPYSFVNKSLYKINNLWWHYSKTFTLYNSQLLNCRLSSLQLNPDESPTPRNSMKTLVPLTTKPALTRFALQMVDVVGINTFQINSASSASEIAVTRKEWKPEETFWNTVLLPGEPV